MKREPPDLSVFDGDWKKLECSSCSIPKLRTSMAYLPEKGGDHIGDPYWHFHSICKPCQISNVQYYSEKEMLSMTWSDDGFKVREP